MSIQRDSETGRVAYYPPDTTTPISLTQADALGTVTQERLTEYRQDKQRLRTFMQASNTSVTLLALVAVVKALVRVLIYKFRELERDDE